MSKGHPLKAYARHVQRNLPGKPSYQWCLGVVTDLFGLTRSMSKEDRKRFLLAEARKLDDGRRRDLEDG